MENLRIRECNKADYNVVLELGKEKGVKLVHLDTFDFQAKDFYLKFGFEVFGVLENCPEGHCRYYLKKMEAR